jgi:hypothetical protein
MAASSPSGPNTSNAQSSVLCSWNASDHYFHCALKTPARVLQGATYYVTALVSVNGLFKPATPYSSDAFDKYPVALTSKADRR